MVHSISKKFFQKFLDSVPWSKVFKKADTTIKGTASDKNNTRLDAGSRVGDKYELIVQPNKGADDSSFKKAAQADSHQILAKGTVNKDSQEEDIDE
ncbi:hypothetical protein G7Y89_g15020 [Cudoniella acicularis]|uniref:Uncharacterized protein n=1 Tax=Cudoniella acicularis TaxID=354080 RepID=A0A8H4QVH4_9HELO|nr:hypothetical protein G7Y89_g15020 [Cudoniella acicularis]